MSWAQLALPESLPPAVTEEWKFIIQILNQNYISPLRNIKP